MVLNTFLWIVGFGRVCVGCCECCLRGVWGAVVYCGYWGGDVGG